MVPLRLASSPKQRSQADVARIQRRTVGVLFVTQVIAGLGAAVGGSVGALLAADIAGIELAGVALSANVVGAALFAVPAAAVVERRGRRPSLAAGYAIGAAGALLIVLAAMRESLPLVFAGLFLFGGVSAASYQARYAAVDLAGDTLRGRHLSLVVWATTIGAVIGPSLAAPAGATLARWGVPTLAGPFVLSALLFSLATITLLLLLRPDPAVVARDLAGAPPVSGANRRGVRAALPVVLSLPAARLGIGATAIGHVVMVGVMTMAPVHIRSAGHDATHTLRLVGVVLSAHIAGMFAFAPVFGWLADKLGRRPVVGIGIGVLLLACLITGTAGHRPAQLSAGLMLLGLGWSATLVSGSALLSEAVPGALRAAAQGLSDLFMGLAGAAAGAASGVVVESWGYPMLTLLGALATGPLVVMLGRRGETVTSRA